MTRLLALCLALAASGGTAAPISSMDFVRRMGLGTNLGNTLEACGDWINPSSLQNFETAWGNPVTTQAMFRRMKQAGFSSVRIPVAWSNRIKGGHQIDPELMNRVEAVVRMAMNEGLITIVNIHWDGGWWQDFPGKYNATLKRYERMWSQIAERFKAYPESLVFESLNEEGCFDKVWDRYKGGSAGKSRAYKILNDINQAFTSLIRASGGVNATRHLLIAGYCTDVDLTVDPAFEMPKDPMKRGIVSVHYYTPFPFAGLEKDASWAKARRTWGTPADMAELDSKLAMLKKRFLDQGVPVIVGEYGAEKKNKDPESVRRFLLTVSEKMHAMGMCPMLWDAGQHMDRRGLRFFDPELEKGYQRILATQRARGR